MKSSKNKKCKQCGGNLVFDPTSQNLICEKCLLGYDFDKTKKYKKHEYDEELDQESEVQNFKCPTCGALFEQQKLNLTSVCPYCASSLIVDQEQIVGLKPDFVVPFEFGKQKAAENFKKGIKKKWFLPNNFKKTPPMDNIEGVYFPAFSFDEKTMSVYEGVLEKDETVSHGDRTTTITRTQRISGKKNLQHTDVMIESTNKLSQAELVGILPYNIENSFDFDNNFILGYSVEYYVDKLLDCKKRADSTIDSIIKSNILSGYHYDRVRYLNISTTRSDEKFAYGILPAYKFTYKYNKKNYITFMNGQTGKVGDGLPKSKIKIALFVMMILLIIAGLVYLFSLGE